MPNFLLFTLISLLFISISIISVYFVTKFISPDFRYRENPVIVSVSALIGIIYAVLVGFTILYELNNFNKAEEAEKEEGKAIIAIYRLARMLPENITVNLRKGVVDYTNHVIHNEWPLMAEGKPVDGTGLALIDSIFKEVHQAFPTNHLSSSQMMIFNNISIATNTLYNDHQERISKTHSALTPNVWFVIILATFLTIGINFLFGIDFRLHVISVIAVSLIVASVFYLIITLDRPYRGDFPIKPTTFYDALGYIKLHSEIRAEKT